MSHQVTTRSGHIGHEPGGLAQLLLRGGCRGNARTVHRSVTPRPADNETCSKNALCSTGPHPGRWRSPAARAARRPSRRRRSSPCSPGRAFRLATGQTGKRVLADPAELIAGRAAFAGFSRRGRVSAGGSSFLLRSADGWCAVTLTGPMTWRRCLRSPACSGSIRLVWRRAGGARSRRRRWRGPPGIWRRRRSCSASRPLPCRRPRRAGRALAAVAQRAHRGAAGRRAAGRRGGRRPVVDVGGAALRAAARPGRRGRYQGRVAGWPDGARSGNREFFDWLHAGHRSLAVDFGTAGRDGPPRGAARGGGRGDRGVPAARAGRPGTGAGHDPAPARPGLAQHHRVRAGGAGAGGVR